MHACRSTLEDPTDYTAGLSKYATYYEGTCSNVACHGTGVTPGTATDGDTMYCYSCHPDQTSLPAEWALLSGHHQQHLEAGLYCAECHSQVVDNQQNVIGGNYHVDGTPQVLPVLGTVVYDGYTCNGTCHNNLHENRVW